MAQRVSPLKQAPGAPAGNGGCRSIASGLTRTFLCLLLGLSALPLAAQWRLGTNFVCSGMCDASAGVAVDTNLFAAANDEDNTLRLFRADAGGPPVATLDLSPFLGLRGRFPETDVEGAAWLGERIYWITSHGCSHEGKYRPNRHRFFATVVRHTDAGARLVPVGAPYSYLLGDMLRDARLRPFNLGVAAGRAPKARGGLNIEGLCATAEGHLLIGFRNPIPNGRALLVPLLNPAEVVAGRPARLGAPVLLDLGGLGVRDLGCAQKKILILAGPYNSERSFRLFTWAGGDAVPEPVAGLDFGKLNPEALVFFPGEARFLVLSDDGTLKVQGVDCKRLTDPSQRRFRAAWVMP
jgi:hypothetical protein